jgi:hypothetical protein
MAKQIPDSIMWILILIWLIPVTVVFGIVRCLILTSQILEEKWAVAWNWPHAHSDYRGWGIKGDE